MSSASLYPRVLSSVALLALFCASPAFASETLVSPSVVQEEQPPEEKDTHLKAWPKVDKSAVKLELERLRKARTPEMGDQAGIALIGMGAGVAPFLLDKLGKDKNEDAVERMISVLEAVTGAPHTRLLAPYFGDKSLGTRVWCLKRVAQYPDTEVRLSAEKAFASVSKRKRKQDKEELYAAAVCCASAGSFQGFELICKDAEAKWKVHGDITHIALTALRGPEATQRVAPLLESSKRSSKVAGLRLLAACGDKETATGLVAPLLDSDDNSLRVGAINALRGIVDGDPPLPRLPVFEAIERANKWKSRL